VTLTVTNNNTQTDQIEHDVTVDNPPTAAFSPSDAVATPTSTLSFDGSGSMPGDGGTIIDYKWDFGDLTPTDDTHTTATDNHTFNLPGVHTVRLTVTDDLGITSSTTHVFTIDQPTAAFTAPQTTVAPNSPASFDATGSTDLIGTIADYSWDFGDQSGTVDAQTTPIEQHTYTTRGVHHVTLTVTNNNRQTDHVTQDVLVDTPPTAAFTPPAGALAPGSQGSFNASGSSAPGGTIASYSWNFGDNTTGSGVSPSHIYANPGTYTVSLTVTDDLGVTSTTITHSVTADATPVAAFSASPNPASTGVDVAFDGSGSSDSLGTITSYSWKFGDSRTDSGATTSHSYDHPNRYSVTLTVTNDAGQTASVTHTITVDAPPVSLFSVAPTAARTGVAVAFDGSSSNDDLGTITSYAWSFGDGAKASGPSASHAYGSPGTYTVALTVTNDAGQSTTSSQIVNVFAAPSASFSINPGAAQPGAAVGFNASSSSNTGGAITGYSWSFGDGAAASGPTPTHAYANPGTYTVTLTVTGSLGLVTSTSHGVTINPRPLSVQFSSNRQSAKTVLKHGLKVTVSTSAPAQATFVVAMPAPTVKQKRKHSKRVAKQRMTTILRSGVFSLAPGAHTVSLKLSAAASSKLRDASKPVVLTVQMTLTDVYGRKASRSVKLTVTR
jgi:PKD repeat protein